MYLSKGYCYFPVLHYNCVGLFNSLKKVLEALRVARIGYIGFLYADKDILI